MSLASRLYQEFQAGIRDRGATYHRRGAVEILSHTYSEVGAVVRGGEDYLVNLSLGRVSLDVACTCPYFADRKSTRLNSSHANISYAVFCLKKKKQNVHEL